MSIKGQGHFLTLAIGHLQMKCKTYFFSNHLTNQSQILYVVSWGWSNESLYKWSRSHDQDGHHDYNLQKPLFFFQNQKAYDFESWPESSGRRALQSFFFINHDPGMTLNYFTARPT